MKHVLQYCGQALVYALFGGLVWYFSSAPQYINLASGKAVIKLSFAHAAQHVSACRTRSPAELQKLAPNMRQARECPRERLPVYVELDIDGRRALSESLPPTGLSGDGASKIYRRLTVSAGTHTINVRLRESARSEGFDFAVMRVVNLADRQNFSIDFNLPKGGFILE